MSNFKSSWSSDKLVNDSSSFWMGDSWFDDTDPLTGEVIEKDNTADLIKLSEKELLKERDIVKQYLP